KPVLGVLPMLDIQLPEEDSQSMDMRPSAQRHQGTASDMQAHREEPYNALAQAIRENVNIKEIYAIMNAGL
ncbi:MAG: hypothetical protein GX916_11150, partial [Clostridiales bacterium]|nr:hypothetical protein [Clostridiales bacterium]